MENLDQNNNSELDGEQKRNVGIPSTSCGSVYRLFGRQKPIHQIMGGGQAADVILWKKWHVSIGVIIMATAAWLLFEWSGLPFLSICSDVLLILVVLLFIRANYYVVINRPLEELPELELSEDLITSAAASFRVKVNYFLLMAHDITLGKDFRLFFMVVTALWLFSVVGSFYSFVTLAYIGSIHQKFSRQYKVVDDDNVRRLSRSISKDKDE